MKKMSLAAVAVILLVGAVAHAEPKVGDVAPEFSLPGTDGKTHKLSELRDKQVVVVAWFPKAKTKGCTAECKSLKADGAKLREFRAGFTWAFPHKSGAEARRTGPPSPPRWRPQA